MREVSADLPELLIAYLAILGFLQLSFVYMQISNCWFLLQHISVRMVKTSNPGFDYRSFHSEQKLNSHYTRIHLPIAGKNGRQLGLPK